MVIPKPCIQMLFLMALTIMVVSANPYRMQRFKTMSMRGLGFWGNPVSVEDNSSEQVISDEDKSTELITNIENPGVEDEMIEHVRNAIRPNQQGQHHPNPGSHTKPNHPNHDVEPLGPAHNISPGDHTKPLRPYQQEQHQHNPGSHTKPNHPQHDVEPLGPGHRISPGDHTKPLRPSLTHSNPPQASVPVAKMRRWFWGWGDSTDEENSIEVSVEHNNPEMGVEQNTIEDQSLEDEILYNLTQMLSSQEIAALQQALALEDVSIEDMLRPSKPGIVPGFHTKPILPPGHHTKPSLPQQAAGHYALSVEDTSVEDMLRPLKPSETQHGIHLSLGSHTKPILPPGHHTKPSHPDHTQALQRPQSPLRQFYPVARSQRFFWDSSEESSSNSNEIDSNEESSSNSNESDSNEEISSNSNESDSNEEVWYQQKPLHPYQPPVPQPRPHPRPYPRPHTRPQPRPTQPTPPAKRPYTRPQPRPTHIYYTEPPTIFVPYNGLIV